MGGVKGINTERNLQSPANWSAWVLCFPAGA